MNVARPSEFICEAAFAIAVLLETGSRTVDEIVAELGMPRAPTLKLFVSGVTIRRSLEALRRAGVCVRLPAKGKATIWARVEGVAIPLALWPLPAKDKAIAQLARELAELGKAHEQLLQVADGRRRRETLLAAAKMLHRCRERLDLEVVPDDEAEFAAARLEFEGFIEEIDNLIDRCNLDALPDGGVVFAAGQPAEHGAIP